MIKIFNIKFVILNIINIKFILFHIIFKNNIVNKKRFNFINKIIFKSQYFNFFFNSNFFFNFDSDIFHKINIKILNL